jgi:F-type H+-transporting ATPase subunit alpha
MGIRPEEITSILAKELEGYDNKAKTEHVGTVLQVGDGIARVHGLPDCQMGELLEFPGGVMGLALNLEEDSIGAVLIGEANQIKEGDPVRETGRIISVPVGEGMLGRVVNPLGQPVDGKGPIENTEFSLLEVIAPGVVKRQPVKEPLQTGIKAIDAMIPIGRGQRELIIGDRQTGKTAICIDAIINQKSTHEPGGSPVYCIYVELCKLETEIVTFWKSPQRLVEQRL